MSYKAADNSSPGYTAAEFRRLGELAAQAGLTIEGFKRQCVRQILYPVEPSSLLTNLSSSAPKRLSAWAVFRSLLRSTPSLKNRPPA